MTVVGVDGCPAGWVAVSSTTDGAATATVAETFSTLYDGLEDPDRLLVDIPIGLPDAAHPRRACDAAARERLRPHRHASVFDPPIREVIDADSYDEANADQKRLIDRGLPIQSWAIADRIRQVEAVLRAGTDTTAIREAHPEVCFATLGDGPMRYSKTGQPAAAVWERLSVLRRVASDPLQTLQSLGSDLDATVSNHDLLDALVLAVVAGDQTGPLRTLPDDPPTDAVGLPMEIVYAQASE